MEIAALVKQTLREYAEDKCPKQAAALAYYTLFALGPFVVLIVAVASLAFGADASRTAMLDQVQRVAGEGASRALADLMGGAAAPFHAGLLGTIVGAIALVIGALGAFAQLKEALNTVWEVDAKPRAGWKAKLWGALRDNVLSFAGVVGAGFLLLVSLAISAVLSALSATLQDRLPGGALAWGAAELLISLVVVALVFAAIFRFVPDARVAWRDTLVGGAVTSVLFHAGQLVLGLYLGRSALATRYGAGASILALLLWVYYSSLIVFLGAELTQVYANRYGSRVRPDERARSIQEALPDKHRPPSEEGTEDPTRRANRERPRDRRAT